MKRLEDAGFGNRVTVKRVEGWMEAGSLEEFGGEFDGCEGYVL